MKFALIAGLMLLPAGTHAAAPEQDYLAARDAHIRAISQADKAGLKEDDRSKLDDKAQGDLLLRLKRIVGPVAPKGVPPEPKLSNDTLLEGDQGFGMIDGLVFRTADYKHRVIVSTEPLLQIWIRAHRNWWRDNNVPQETAAALRSEAFYTQAMSQDSAVIRYLDLPIKPPRGARFAFAMLIDRAQDIGPREPNEVIVTVLRDGRLFIVHAPARVHVPLIPACVALWETALKKSAALYEGADRAISVTDRASKMRDDGDAAFHRCFVERAKPEPYLPQLIRRAQTLADDLPAR